MKDNPTLNISELFYSIQGESTYAGLPCVFIRLHGCNLRCHYCDAKYTYDEPGEKKSLSELLHYVDLFENAIVEITGGEPLLQNNCLDLAKSLCKNGRRVLIETNGSVDVSAIPDGVITILDIKCPGSGMSQHVLWDNIRHLRPSDEVKFVLSSRTDFDWAIQTINNQPALLGKDPGKVLFSPVTDDLPAQKLADWMLKERPHARMQLQLHKQIWPDSQRGV